MHALETAYTVYANKRRQRHGPLVGRYKAKPVEDDNYHLALSRYVHRNPIRTQAMLEPPLDERLALLRSYRWSSYWAYVGQEKAPEWLAQGPVLVFCGRTLPEQHRQYARFVESGLGRSGAEDEGPIKASPFAVGGMAFIDRIRALLMESSRRTRNPEDTALRVKAPVFPAERILEVVANGLRVDPADLKKRHRNSDLRGIAARMLCRHAGLTQRQAAAVLDIGTGAAINKQLLRLETRLRQDAGLRRRIEAIESRLR